MGGSSACVPLSLEWVSEHRVCTGRAMHSSLHAPFTFPFFGLWWGGTWGDKILKHLRRESPKFQMGNPKVTACEPW